jgi:16S rRNA (cytosine967-C5)-methyltransferase
MVLTFPPRARPHSRLPENNTYRPQEEGPKGGSQKDGPGVAARRAAFKLAQAVVWQGRVLQDSIEYAFQGLHNPSDRALAHSTVLAMLRRLTYFDDLIDSCTRNPLDKDARARLVLRLALAQALVLETPPHAVIATHLPLVEGGPRKLVHGILSKLLKNPDVLPIPALPDYYNYKWAHDYSPEIVDGIAAAYVGEPPLDLVFKNADDIAKYFPEWSTDARFFDTHLRIHDMRGRVEALPGYDEGAWWVQDVAAQVPVKLINPKIGETIIDVCAAPGGKTMQLANAGANVIALDIAERRLERVRDNLHRASLKAKTIAADALKWSPPELVDAVLLDAPCSATGTLRRHPDVLFRKAGRDMKDLLETQRALIKHTATWLKPGGRLIYAVCSLEPEEGIAQAGWAAQNTGLTAQPFAATALGPLSHCLRPDGTVQTLPSHLATQGGVDGFFIAGFRRK